jgi:hypothetical protein
MKRRGGGILAAGAVALVLGSAAGTAHAQQCGAFTDVFITDSYCPASEWLKNRGVTTGCTATAYCPSNNVTRAQMALFMNRLGTPLTPRLVSSQGQIGPTTAVNPGGSAILCQTAVSAAVNYAQQVRARGTLSANMTSNAVGLAPVLSLNGGPFTSMVGNEMLINASGNELLHWSSNLVGVAPGSAISVGLRATNHGTTVLSFGSNGRCAIEVEALNANPVAPTPCGPAGCVVAAVDGVGNPTLTVPAGALPGPVAITMLDRTGDPADPSVFHVYTFGPPGTKFSTPATVNLPAPPLTAGQTAVIEVSDDGVTWTAVPTTLNAGRVSGPISHFSMCRTRAVVVGSEGLNVVDAVGYQEFIARMIPPPGEAGSCNTGDFFGVCVKVKNPWGFPLSSNCPVPTPSPAPIGCIQLTVIPWQCSNANRTLLPFNPGNPSAYEGQHCNRSGGFLIPCPASVYNMDQLLPGGTLAAGAEYWVNLNFVVNPPTPANGVNPYSCIATSGFFIGFDILFRDPFASDWQAGIRSAKDGPFVAIQNTRQYWVPAGVAGCNPTPPATRCQRTCNQTTCQVEWDWLANHDANYPTLRCARPGTPNTFINCAQYQSGDIANKNWFLDSAQ